MTELLFKLNNLSHSFGSVQVIHDLSLHISRGEFIAIVGPSGCGKTTLLNILSDHEQPTSGSIIRRGRMRMVYQTDGLFPWLNVSENISMGLEHLSDITERNKQLNELIELIGLNGFEKYYPHKLSGGMRQRVELARALAGDSDTLLLDEPFSALDYLTRLRMRSELARMLEERPRTVILVTHDIEEAAQLADRIIVLSERPAKIACEVTLSESRPRDLTHPSVTSAVHKILSVLGYEKNNMECGNLLPL